MTDKQKLDAVLMMLQPNSNITTTAPVRRKETRQQIYNRLLNEVNQFETLKSIKKNLC
jgi:hypothetical protein